MTIAETRSAVLKFRYSLLYRAPGRTEDKSSKSGAQELAAVLCPRCSYRVRERRTLLASTSSPSRPSYVRSRTTGNPPGRANRLHSHGALCPTDLHSRSHAANHHRQDIARTWPHQQHLRGLGDGLSQGLLERRRVAEQTLGGKTNDADATEFLKCALENYRCRAQSCVALRRASTERWQN